MRVAFREGQDVKKGQVLFELDPRPFQAALEQAEAPAGARPARTATNAGAGGQALRGAGGEGVRDRAAVRRRRGATPRPPRPPLAGEPGRGRPGAAQSAVRHDPGADLGPHRQPARARGQPGRGSTDAQPLVTINQIQPILVRFAVPASNLPLIQQYRGNRIAVVRAEPTGGGDRERGHAGVRGQRGGHRHRHDPAQGQLPQRRRRALARASS